MLAFQHPGFGALGFVLGASDVEKIVRVLTTHLGNGAQRGDRVDEAELTAPGLDQSL